MTDETKAPAKSPPPSPTPGAGPQTAPWVPQALAETPPVPEAKPSGPGWNFAGAAASRFLLPKSFPTTAELLYMPSVVPTIHITQLALMKIYIIVSLIEMEVGWLGTAKRHGDVITIDEVFLFEQSVSYGHSELNTDSMASVMQEVLKRPDGEEIFNNIRFWGHSHGFGGIEPSQQDNETMEIFEGFGADFFIRGIFNRVGNAGFSIYDWKNNVAFHRAPWKLIGKPLPHKVYQGLLAELPTEMQQKVIHTRPTYTPPKASGKRAYFTPDPRYPIWDPRRYGFF